MAARRQFQNGPGGGKARVLPPESDIMEDEGKNQLPLPEERYSYWHRRIHRENAPTETERGLTTKTGTTMMKQNSGRKKPVRGWAVQFPDSGFEHPFQDSSYNAAGPRRGREHPRTVSASSPGAAISFR